MLIISLHTLANDSTKLYDPKADVEKDVAIVVAKEKKENMCSCKLVATGAYAVIVLIVLFYSMLI